MQLGGGGPVEKGQLSATVPILRKDVQNKSDALQLQFGYSTTTWNIFTMSDTAVDILSIRFKKHCYFYGRFKCFDWELSALKISFAM